MIIGRAESHAQTVHDVGCIIFVLFSIGPIVAQSPTSLSLIRAGRMLDPRTGNVLAPAAVLIEDGKIATIGREIDVKADKKIDAKGRLVIPGGIDPHVHYAMNFEHIILTEGPPYSFAAAIGGNTSVIDFAFQELGIAWQAIPDCL